MLDMSEADINAMADEGARQQLREYREQQLLQEDQVPAHSTVSTKKVP